VAAIGNLSEQAGFLKNAGRKLVFLPGSLINNNKHSLKIQKEFPTI